MEWISVLKEMPDFNKNPFVLITDGQNMYVAYEWYICKGEPLETTWSYSDCCGCTVEGITHWMPLPAHPIA